ncbi:MAG: hypothetical protein ACRD9Q_06940 [Nitrososphaeraceae archaeon]
MSDNLTMTLIQRLEEYFEAKIAEGYQIVDRESYLTLRKMAMQDLKVARGSWTRSADALKIVMEKRGIKVPDEIQAKSIEGIKIKLIKSEVPIPQAPAPEPKSPFGTLPAPEKSPGPQAPAGQAPPQPTEQIKIVTQEQADAWERGLTKAFDMVTRLYAKTGLIEVEDVKPAKEKMTLKDYTDETDLLAHDWAIYCKENNIHLPKSLELAMLMSESVVIFGSPLFKFLIFRKKGKKTEEVKELGKDTEKDSKKDSEL